MILSKSDMKRTCTIVKMLIGLCVMGTVSLCGQTSTDLSTKYQHVSGYELRSGILMIPQFSQEGQVCEMTLEKQHHQATGKIDLDSSIPRKLVRELIDELVPTTERGKPTNVFTEKWDFLTTISGNLTVEEADFENISIQIHGTTSQSCDAGEEVVIIRWKNRTCFAPKLSSTAAKSGKSLLSQPASPK